jgi:phosphatidylglycerophosphate synthase
VVGSILGLAAGAVQWALGADIPEWTGNKMHPVQLGIITIALSLLTLACVSYLENHREGSLTPRLTVGFLMLAATVVCFTTVGRLWFLPGALLLASLVLLFSGRPRRSRDS